MSGLRKLARLYARVERARLVEVRSAALACEEVKQLNLETKRDVAVQNELARAAFASGDAAQSKVTDAVRAAALVRGQRLLQALGERELTLQAAEALHRESRLQAEQMAKVVEAAGRQAALDDARRALAAADDRYGSRLRWTQARDEGPLM